MEAVEAIAEAARIIARLRSISALTGAGISADSGVPTFRGPDGLWRRFRPEELATPEAFRRNPKLVWEWYKWRMEVIARARPNPGHYALAELEHMGLLRCIVTQNVDGLHQRAGSRNVIELHGSIWRARCTECGYRVTLSEPPREIPPRCPRCGGLLRPDVVWFGEPIPEDAWRKALECIAETRVLLVVGTSGVVYPAALLPRLAKRRGSVVIEVNIEPSALTEEVTDIFIQGRAADVLPRLVEEVKRLITRSS